MTALTRMRVASLIQVGACGLLGAFESVHMQNRGLPEAQIGLIMAVESGLMMITALLWGRIADLTQRFRLSMTIATVGMVLTFGCFAYAESFAGFMMYWGPARHLFHRDHGADAGAGVGESRSDQTGQRLRRLSAVRLHRFHLGRVDPAAVVQ